MNGQYAYNLARAVVESHRASNPYLPAVETLPACPNCGGRMQLVRAMVEGLRRFRCAACKVERVL